MLKTKRLQTKYFTNKILWKQNRNKGVKTRIIISINIPAGSLHISLVRYFQLLSRSEVIHSAVHTRSRQAHLIDKSAWSFFFNQTASLILPILFPMKSPMTAIYLIPKNSPVSSGVCFHASIGMSYFSVLVYLSNGINGKQVELS